MWKGEVVTTGIFKKPISQPIYLSKNEVKKDEISDRVHHGGPYKACYLFSSDHYPYWKTLYPNLDWDWGMFGENLTVSGFDERDVFLGDVYQVGEALVQVSQHREPCYKLGYKFGTQEVIQQFIQYGFAGTYLTVLKEGMVAVDDVFSLVERPIDSLTVAAFFKLFYAKEKDQELLKIAVNSQALPPKKRVWLRKYLK